MSDPIVRAAASVEPPYRGAIYSDDTSTTNQYLDLDQTLTDPVTGVSTPKFLRGRFLTIQALSADLYLQFTSSNATTIDPTAAAGDFANANCIVIPAGQSLTLLIPRGNSTTNMRYLCYRTASGTGAVRAWPSSPPGL